MRHAKWSGGDPRRAVASEAGDAVDAGGFDGFGEGQIGQDGGEPARQHRLPRAWGAEHPEVMVRTLASASA